MAPPGFGSLGSAKSAPNSFPAGEGGAKRRKVPGDREAVEGVEARRPVGFSPLRPFKLPPPNSRLRLWWRISPYHPFTVVRLSN